MGDPIVIRSNAGGDDSSFGMPDDQRTTGVDERESACCADCGRHSFRPTF